MFVTQLDKAHTVHMFSELRQMTVADVVQRCPAGLLLDTVMVKQLCWAGTNLSQLVQQRGTL
jgi:hypothetical protein